MVIMSLKKILVFLEDVKREIKKISWIKKRELINLTIIVILVVFIFALLSSLFDSFLYYIIKSLLQ